MRIAVIELARSVFGIFDANPSDFSPNSANSVIDSTDDRRGGKMGGIMRLGVYPFEVQAGTRLYSAYGQKTVFERHRHCFGSNNSFCGLFQGAGTVAALNRYRRKNNETKSKLRGT